MPPEPAMTSSAAIRSRCSQQSSSRQQEPTAIRPISRLRSACLISRPVTTAPIAVPKGPAAKMSPVATGTGSDEHRLATYGAARPIGVT